MLNHVKPHAWHRSSYHDVGILLLGMPGMPPSWMHFYKEWNGCVGEMDGWIFLDLQQRWASANGCKWVCLSLSHT